MIIVVRNNKRANMVNWRRSKLPLIAVILQVLFILIFGIFGKYGESAQPVKPASSEGDQTLYPCKFKNCFLNLYFVVTSQDHA